MAFFRIKTPGELLSEAAQRGDCERVAQLLAEGAPIDWVEPGVIAGGQTALHRARSPEVVQLLLSAGADARARDDHGYTPLHYAHEPDAMRLLIASGADVNGRSDNGSTVLHYALYSYSYDAIVEPYRIAPLLQLPGIDLNARNEDGCTPLWLAIQRDERCDNPYDQQLAKLLVQAGADLDDEGALQCRQSLPPSATEFEEREDEDREDRAERWEMWDAKRRNPDPWDVYDTPREYLRASNIDPENVKEIERIANSWKTSRLLESAMDTAHSGDNTPRRGPSDMLL